MRSIQITKTLFFIILTFTFALTGLAQSLQPVERDARATIVSRQLRFASHRPVEHLRLQVHDKTGTLIHDSGRVEKNDLSWSLRDDKGNALKVGLYDWTLTVKEAGEASPRVKRGQLDLENANQPDSANLSAPSALAPVIVGGSGTAGKIPIWTSATDLGDSIIAEDNGHVAIGSTPGSNIRLRVYLKPDDINAAEAIQAVLQQSQDPDGQTTGSAVYALVQGPLGSNQGVWGLSESNIGIGVHGTALHEPDPDNPTAKSAGIGVKGVSKSLEGIGVEGIAGSITGENVGVRGESKSEDGVGVLGEMKVSSGVTFGVKGLNSSMNGRGVLGYATDPSGVNFGVVGRTDSPNGFAGFFIGRVHVAGFLSKAAGAFKIDHPLDPENKYLSHSFVESPDMMNIYNGIVTLGKDGSAEVTLPDWFEALNREFRYQLTCIGDFAPVFVARKVNGNRFKIAGGKAGMEVSWQLTGVRKDAYAEYHRIQVEEMKPVEERGSYLYPEAFGKSEEKGVLRAREKALQN
ncbi:MAG: hypothetical protein MOB07_21430 [Acidobacteria bacterium]|nr:hypothetical protein [Acidobacteriota bacterium]